MNTDASKRVDTAAEARTLAKRPRRPRSEAAKRRTRMNALKHGIFAAGY
jgi:hypothetical protein